MNLSKLVETEGMIEVANLGEGGYDWSEIQVWWHPANRRFYWLSESGCSCSYFGNWDPYTLGDLEDGDRQAAIAALRDFGYPRDQAEAEMAAVRDYKHELAA